jgi:hypothetical protein
MPDLKLYTIAYSQETYSDIEPGYLILDNRENRRPDWREYWPIRNFLLNERLDESALYGFFSPKFRNKTGLSYQQVEKYIQTSIGQNDVFLFTTYPDLGAACINVFEQKEFVDKGFTQLSQLFLDSLGYNVDLANLVMDSKATVFSNFFIASKKFWLVWLGVCERIFSMCEDGGRSALCQGFTAETTYKGHVQRKVFLIERVASLLLSTQQWKVKSYNAWSKSILTPMLAKVQHEMVVSDALKIAYNKTHYEEYLAAYRDIRNEIFKQ